MSYLEKNVRKNGLYKLLDLGQVNYLSFGFIIPMEMKIPD